MAAPVQKALEFDYLAKLNKTGLTDVKATIELNGVTKASNLVLTEVDATNSPGLYRLALSAATLIGYGIASGQTNTLTAYITSASYPAASIARIDATIANLDDVVSLIGTPVTTLAGDIAALSTKVGTPAGASLAADVAAVKVDTAAIKVDLETGASNLATILGAIQTLQNASIGNGVGFVLPQMAIPATGSQVYKIPVTIQNDAGALVDPTSNTITVSVANASGVDRGAYLTGSSGSPATVVATRSAAGVYYAMLSIPSTAPEEELIFSFAYTLAGNAQLRYGQSLLVNDAAGAGYALQSSSVAIKAVVDAIKADVESATTGLPVIQGLLANGTFGLSAIQTIAAAVQSAVNNGTYGLAAANTLQLNIQALLNNGTFGLSALQAQSAAIQGAGYTAGDDLHSIKAYLNANLFVGGKAV